MLYPRTLTAPEVWSHLAKRLAAYVFLTPTNWCPESDAEKDEGKRIVRAAAPLAYKTELSEKVVKLEDYEVEQEHCAMCADRRKYWASSLAYGTANEMAVSGSSPRESVPVGDAMPLPLRRKRHTVLVFDPALAVDPQISFEDAEEQRIRTCNAGPHPLH
ncbi:hypothetical protein C0992_002922 [Termitomyces sp. T32_za158]|nr:hypothetical protein C0992_002922 [Termitomyces sp. T32_za158]